MIQIGPDSLQHIRRDRVDSCSDAVMSLSLITDASSFNEIPAPLKNGLVSRRIHIKFEFESTLHSHNTGCFMKFQHAPAALL
jgi:hypothetical protein